MKKLIFALLLGAALALCFFYLKNVGSPLFPGLTGPTKESIVSAETPTPWEAYGKGESSRLAILLTDPDSNWLPLVHGLKTIGIPLMITKDYRTAFAHQTVLAYPVISGKALPEAALKAIPAFLEAGGTLIGENVLGGGLQGVFGFGAAEESDSHLQVNFDQAAVGELTPLNDPRELLLPLGSAGKGNPLGSVGYSSGTAKMIARFEDGRGALIAHQYGKGTAYALGFDLGQLLHRGYANRDEAIARSYVNAYEPAIDVMLRILREIYSRAGSGAVTLGTVPEGKAISVMVTHDIDFTKSLNNAIEYAIAEKNLAVRATYFMQTKYIRDFNDDIFFSPEHIGALKKISELGMEVGSHTVSHSRQFAKFPLGDGKESYPAYAPFVKTKNLTENGTVLGELRVSKFLIDNFLAPKTVISFRPGELSNPYSLPQALVATEYSYSSSVTANNSLTHLPFQLTWGRNSRQELPIFDFPVTIEDEELPALGDRIGAASQLAEKLTAYGGIFVILVHPNILEHKLKFVTEFIKAWKARAWFGSVSDIGAWWAARNQVEIDERIEPRTRTVKLEIPRPLSGLVLRLPLHWHPSGALPAGAVFNPQTHSLVLGAAQGKVMLTLAAD